MAPIHNALKRSPIADGLKKAIGQHKQGEGGLERWSETLQGVVNPWGMPEWAVLRGERLGAIRLFQAAVAAEFGAIALGNPLNSGNIVVVEGVSFNATTAALGAILEVVPDTTIAATLTVVAIPGSFRDKRFGGGNPGRTFIRTGSDPTNTFGAQLEGQTHPGPAVAFSAFQCLPVMLRPGDDLMVIGQTVNLAMTVNFVWRERVAFPGELG